MIAVWRPRAERDLDNLIRYIAQYNVQAAVALDLRIEHIVELLELNPQLGHVVGTLGMREFNVTRNVKLLYWIRPRLKVFEIVRVLHTRKKYP